jgi:hypothetical protein
LDVFIVPRTLTVCTAAASVGWTWRMFKPSCPWAGGRARRIKETQKSVRRRAADAVLFN